MARRFIENLNTNEYVIYAVWLYQRERERQREGEQFIFLKDQFFATIVIDTKVASHEV